MIWIIEIWKQMYQNLFDRKTDYYVDLGPSATCNKCNQRFCDCIERQNGTLENTLVLHKKD